MYSSASGNISEVNLVPNALLKALNSAVSLLNICGKKI